MTQNTNTETTENKGKLTTYLSLLSLSDAEIIKELRKVTKSAKELKRVAKSRKESQRVPKICKESQRNEISQEVP